MKEEMEREKVKKDNLVPQLQKIIHDIKVVADENRDDALKSYNQDERR